MENGAGVGLALDPIPAPRSWPGGGEELEGGWKSGNVMLKIGNLVGFGVAEDERGGCADDEEEDEDETGTGTGAIEGRARTVVDDEDEDEEKTVGGRAGATG